MLFRSDIDLAVRGIKEGATDFVVKPWNNQKLVALLLISANAVFPSLPTVSAVIFSSCDIAIDGEVWHLDVGSSHPGAEFGPKGLAVRQLKRYASWVQNVVRQFGPYLLRAQEY